MEEAEQNRLAAEGARKSCEDSHAEFQVAQTKVHLAHRGPFCCTLPPRTPRRLHSARFASSWTHMCGSD